MKLGILSESGADEAGIRILAEAIIGEVIEVVDLGRIQPRGWTGVFKAVGAVIPGLQYRSDASGLIVVVDSDDTKVHNRDHDGPGPCMENCRTCELLSRTKRACAKLRPRDDGTRLRVAVGIATPAIEAWYRCGVDVHSSEAHFTRLPVRELYHARKDLKTKLYGRPVAPEHILLAKAEESATRLAQDIGVLERHFPIGFGMLAQTLRTWK